MSMGVFLAIVACRCINNHQISILEAARDRPNVLISKFGEEWTTVFGTVDSNWALIVP